MAVNLNIRPSYHSQVVSKSIESIPETILAMLQAKQDKSEMELRRQQLESSQAIAERTMALQEGKYQWEKGIQEKIDNSKRALSKWTSQGYAWDALSNSDSREVYGSIIPSDAKGWTGYQADMQSFGGDANQFTFLKEKKANDQNFMSEVYNRWTADVDAIKSTRAYQDGNAYERNQLLEQHLNASNVYRNYAIAFGPQAAEKAFQGHYIPGLAEERGWLQKGKDWWFGSKQQEDMSDLDALRQQARGLGQSQEISPGKIGTGLALAEGARRLYKGRMGSLTKDITDKLDKFNKQFRTDDIDYGKSNRPIGKSPVKQPSAKELKQMARKKLLPGGGKISKLFKGTPSFLAPAIGKSVDETLGTGATAQVLGTGVAAWKTVPSEQKAGFLKFLMKKLPATATKHITKSVAKHTALASTGVGAHPISQGALAVANVAALGWSVADLYQEYLNQGK